MSGSKKIEHEEDHSLSSKDPSLFLFKISEMKIAPLDSLLLLQNTPTVALNVIITFSWQLNNMNMNM